MSASLARVMRDARVRQETRLTDAGETLDLASARTLVHASTVLLLAVLLESQAR